MCSILSPRVGRTKISWHTKSCLTPTAFFPLTFSSAVHSLANFSHLAFAYMLRCRNLFLPLSVPFYHDFYYGLIFLLSTWLQVREWGFWSNANSIRYFFLLLLLLLLSSVIAVICRKVKISMTKIHNYPQYGSPWPTFWATKKCANLLYFFIFAVSNAWWSHIIHKHRINFVWIKLSARGVHSGNFIRDDANSPAIWCN